MSMQQPTIFMTEALQRYRGQWQGEEATVAQFETFLHTRANAFERSNATGHFTGSAWLVSADGARVLLMHHRKLDRWLQPGGHADGDTDLARVALREAQEETGVIDLRVEGGIFDIDRHRIKGHVPVACPDGPAPPFAFAPGERNPTRGDEAEHWHYDVRYVVRAGEDERFAINEESQALAWRSVISVATDSSFDASLRRMAHKWLARDGVSV
jgi:8-oxo-dGTP pyrophosphatase MutT (NUDIX family)